MRKSKYNQIYDEVYAKYKTLRDILPKRENYDTKADFARAYHKSAINMLNILGYTEFINRIRLATEYTLEDYVYMVIFDRINKMNDMKAYVFLQDSGMIRESQLKCRFRGFRLTDSLTCKYQFVSIYYKNKIERRTICTYSSEISDTEIKPTKLHIIPNKKGEQA